MTGRGRSATSEVTKTMSPRARLDHRPVPRPRTSRWVPLTLTASTPSERVGIGVEHRAGRCSAGVRHQDLDRAEGVHGRRGELLDRVPVRQIEMDGDGLATVVADGRRRVLAVVHPPGAEHDRVPEPGQGHRRRLPDARRRAGDHGRTSLGVGLETGHQRSCTVVGRAARPRTLIEWTRSMPSGSMS